MSQIGDKSPPPSVSLSAPTPTKPRKRPTQTAAGNRPSDVWGRTAGQDTPGRSRLAGLRSTESRAPSPLRITTLFAEVLAEEEAEQAVQPSMSPIEPSRESLFGMMARRVGFGASRPEQPSRTDRLVALRTDPDRKFSERVVIDHLIMDDLVAAENAIRNWNEPIHADIMNELATMKLERAEAEAAAPAIETMRVLSPRPASSAAASPQLQAAIPDTVAPPLSRTPSPMPEDDDLTPTPVPLTRRAPLSAEQRRALATWTVAKSHIDDDEPELTVPQSEDVRNSRGPGRQRQVESESAPRLTGEASDDPMASWYHQRIDGAIERGDLGAVQQVLEEVPEDFKLSASTAQRLLQLNHGMISRSVMPAIRTAAGVFSRVVPGVEVELRADEWKMVDIAWAALLNRDEDFNQLLNRLGRDDRISTSAPYKRLMSAAWYMKFSGHVQSSGAETTKYQKITRFIDAFTKKFEDKNTTKSFSLSKAWGVLSRDVKVSTLFRIYSRSFVDANEYDQIQNAFSTALSTNQQTLRETLDELFLYVKDAVHGLYDGAHPNNKEASRLLVGIAGEEIDYLAASERAGSPAVRGAKNLIKLFAYSLCIDADIDAPRAGGIDPEAKEARNTLLDVSHPDHVPGFLALFDRLDGGGARMEYVFLTGKTRFGKTMTENLLAKAYGPAQVIEPNTRMSQLVAVPLPPRQDGTPAPVRVWEPNDLNPEDVCGIINASRVEKGIRTWIHEECDSCYSGAIPGSVEEAKFVIDPTKSENTIKFRIKHHPELIVLTHPQNSGMYIGSSNSPLPFYELRLRFSPYLVFIDMTTKQQNNILDKAFEKQLKVIVDAWRERGTFYDGLEQDIRDRFHEGRRAPGPGEAGTGRSLGDIEDRIWREIDAGPPPPATVIQDVVSEVLSMIADQIARGVLKPNAILSYIPRFVEERRGAPPDYNYRRPGGGDSEFDLDEADAPHPPEEGWGLPETSMPPPGEGLGTIVSAPAAAPVTRPQTPVQRPTELDPAAQMPAPIVLVTPPTALGGRMLRVGGATSRETSVSRGRSSDEFFDARSYMSSGSAVGGGTQKEIFERVFDNHMNSMVVAAKKNGESYIGMARDIRARFQQFEPAIWSAIQAGAAIEDIVPEVLSMIKREVLKKRDDVARDDSATIFNHIRNPTRVRLGTDSPASGASRRGSVGSEADPSKLQIGPPMRSPTSPKAAASESPEMFAEQFMSHYLESENVTHGRESGLSPDRQEQILRSAQQYLAELHQSRSISGDFDTKFLERVTSSFAGSPQGSPKGKGKAREDEPSRAPIAEEVSAEQVARLNLAASAAIIHDLKQAARKEMRPPDAVRALVRGGISETLKMRPIYIAASQSSELSEQDLSAASKIKAATDKAIDRIVDAVLPALRSTSGRAGDSSPEPTGLNDGVLRFLEILRLDFSRIAHAASQPELDEDVIETANRLGRTLAEEADRRNSSSGSEMPNADIVDVIIQLASLLDDHRAALDSSQVSGLSGIVLDKGGQHLRDRLVEGLDEAATGLTDLQAHLSEDQKAELSSKISELYDDLILARSQAESYVSGDRKMLGERTGQMLYGMNEIRHHLALPRSGDERNDNERTLNSLISGINRAIVSASFAEPHIAARLANEAARQ